MRTATKLKDLNSTQVLWELSEAVEFDYDYEADEYRRETNFVVTSVPYNPALVGPETYIFPADQEGEILNWGELDGSFKGGMDHSQAIERAGFKAVRP